MDKLLTKDEFDAICWFCLVAVGRSSWPVFGRLIERAIRNPDDLAIMRKLHYANHNAECTWPELEAARKAAVPLITEFANVS